MIQARAIAGLIAMALLCPASAPNAAEFESIRPGQRPPAGSDEDELWYAMERAERDLAASPTRVRDPDLEGYVREVACRVAGEYCPDLRVYVVEQPWFNAMMAPNGMMIVWTGALLRMTDEAELAVVLGHEFAHFRQRHSIQQWRKTKRTTAFMSSFALATFGAGIGIAGTVGNLAGAASLFAHSRDKEREADDLGLAAAAAAGYDPKVGARLWERLQREESARRYGKPIPVFATHPRTAERAQDVRAAAERLAVTGELRPEAFRRAMRPHLPAWLEGELSRRMYDTSIQVVGELRESAEPDLAGLYTFYLGETYRRRGKDDDRARAGELYAEATRLPGVPAAAFRELGHSLRERGRLAEAGHAFARYLELAPDAEDRAFIEPYLTDTEEHPS